MAQLYQPSALTLDSAGNLFIADSGTQRIRQMTRDGTLTTLAGTGAASPGATDGSPAGNTALNTPMGVVMDSAGNVVVADTYNHRVLLVTLAGAIRTMAGTGTRRRQPRRHSTPAAQLQGRAPCAPATGNLSGTLYIVDTSNHRVLRLPPGGLLQTAAGNGSQGSAGDGGAARLAQLNMPGACATDSTGNLFIADTANHAIRKVNPAGVISTVAGVGAPGTSGDEGAATDARLDSPRGVVVDDMGDIFIADTGNHRIRQVTPDGVIHSIAGTGASGFAGDGGPAAGAPLNGPQGLFLDGAGDLYFADTGNNRIRRLVPDPWRLPP
jgi:sugar lactone lactonase YvrE